MRNKLFIFGTVLFGIVFFGLALYYWLTPAGSLPAYFPGFEAGSTHIHFKHGLASLLLSLALFVFAWFQSAPSKKVSSGESLEA